VQQAAGYSLKTNILYINIYQIQIDINRPCTKIWRYMILLCWRRINVLLDADYGELNTYSAGIRSINYLYQQSHIFFDLR